MILHAIFTNNQNEVTTGELFQWDIGQQLCIEGLSGIDENTEVHFANNRMIQAIVKTGAYENDTLTVDIPNEFLQSGGVIHGKAWVYVTENSTIGKTIKTIKIPIVPRKRPNDYVSPADPDSKGIVEQALEILRDGTKVSYVTNATVDNATETGKVYYTTVGSSKALIVPVSGDSNQVQFRLDRDGKIYARRRSRSSTSVDFPAWGIFEQTGWTSAEISAMIDSLVDPTLSVQGKAADARAVGDKIAELYDMCETYNLYDPALPYTGMNKAGTASDNLKSKMVIGNNGNITCTASMSSTGSVYVANQGRTLKAGTYTMSGKMTFHDSAPDSVRRVYCDIGRHSSSLNIVLKTQRGGTTNIANSDKEGWFAGTFTIEEDQADFTFMVIPESNAVCNTNLPAIISNLQIISGSEIGVYSPNRYTNVDIPLRDESSRQSASIAQNTASIAQNTASIAQNTASIAQNTLALKNSNGIIYTTYTARHTFSVSTATGGLTVTIGGDLNTRLYGDSATKNWEDISSEISDNIVIDGSSATITIPSYSQALVYNAGDKKLHIRNLSQNSGLVIDDIVLVANAYANPVGGCLYNEYIDRMVTDTGDFVHSNEILSRSFNAAYHTGATNFAEKCKEFSTLLKGTIDKSTGNVDVIAPTNFESFLFFTDPHLLEGSAWENRCQEFIAQIQKYYNSTPTSFCLCGGDWLGNSDLPDDACFKLGYIDGFMHSMFDNCYMILGNHDTNYQGKRDASSTTYTTRLTNQSLVDLWYRGGKRAYYTFDGANTKFYCLDTQTESDTLWTFNNYGAQQVAWFGNSLLTDNAPHIALAMHILYNWFSANNGVVDSASSSVNPIAAEVVKIAAAYNARSNVTFNGTTYDYSSATGRIEFLICGHAHKDFEVEELAGNGITTLALDFPCIGTLNVRKDESLGASFDLCFADYDNREIKLIRVGSGENRTISLGPAVSG